MARRTRITSSIPSDSEGAYVLERERLAGRHQAGEDARVGGADGVSDRGARGGQAGAPPEEGVPLDSAIDAMLAAGGVDAVTRVRLSEARRAITEGVPGTTADGFEGQSLSRALFRFVMPRLRHPEVLRAERHRALLEDLADELAADGGDGVVREGALVVHRELRRLALLRAGRNALVEG
ncbi:hypothetical protein LPLAFNJD_LOCUS4417 [Methylorubrum aminovorans]|nr:MULTISPECIES: hypothetical protein [unclassified Methylobacterium]QIJ76047.1 hypothetical protein CLZ_16390 [Methylobacterium sp. CLZ]QIJ80949.1 hypothetical protein GU700_16395 [Methylobacterium sp. NI91]